MWAPPRRYGSPGATELPVPTVGLIRRLGGFVRGLILRHATDQQFWLPDVGAGVRRVERCRVSGFKLYISRGRGFARARRRKGQGGWECWGKRVGAGVVDWTSEDINYIIASRISVFNSMVLPARLPTTIFSVGGLIIREKEDSN